LFKVRCVLVVFEVILTAWFLVQMTAILTLLLSKSKRASDFNKDLAEYMKEMSSAAVVFYVLVPTVFELGCQFFAVMIVSFLLGKMSSVRRQW
jgi:hypothetical protein